MPSALRPKRAVLKEEFLPYMPVVMPIVLAAAALDPQLRHVWPVRMQSIRALLRMFIAIIVLFFITHANIFWIAPTKIVLM